MASFEITLNNQTVQRVAEAEAYQLEGPLTTFFTSENGHGRLDSWSTRLASFRSADVVMIRRVDDLGERAGSGTVATSSRPELELVVGAD